MRYLFSNSHPDSIDMFVYNIDTPITIALEYMYRVNFFNRSLVNPQGARRLGHRFVQSQNPNMCSILNRLQCEVADFDLCM